jgi:hypothetical protein
MGVFPQLKITHLIPARRCSLEYLLRNLEAHEHSHHVQHYARHGAWPADSGPRARLRRGLRWLQADKLERQMMAAEARGRASARHAIAMGRDTRPVTHR